MRAHVERWLFIPMAFALLAAATGTAQAQPARTFADLERSDRVAIGDRITVEDDAGQTSRGRVLGLDATSLTLRIDAGGRTVQRVFTETEVRRIRRKGSSVMAISALTGAVAAFGITAAAAASYGRNEGGRFCGGCLVQWSTLSVPVGAGIGALVGFTIDRTTVRTVFARHDGTGRSVSIAPLVGNETLGGFATIRF